MATAADLRLDEERAEAIAEVAKRLDELQAAEDREAPLYAEIRANLELARRQLLFAIRKYFSQ